MNIEKLKNRVASVFAGYTLDHQQLILDFVYKIVKRMIAKNNKQGQKISALEAELQLQVNTGSSSKDQRIAELEDKIKKMEYKVRPGYYEIKNILIENERLRKVLAHSVDRIVELEMQNKDLNERNRELNKKNKALEVMHIVIDAADKVVESLRPKPAFEKGCVEGFDLNDVVIRDQKINELKLEISIFEQFKSQHEHSIKVLKTALASKMKEVSSLNEKLNQIREILK